jgi:hypothetical protein
MTGAAGTGDGGGNTERGAGIGDGEAVSVPAIGGVLRALRTSPKGHFAPGLCRYGPTDGRVLQRQRLVNTMYQWIHENSFWKHEAGF